MKTRRKITKEIVIDRCNELDFEYINHYIGLYNNKKCTVVEFICHKHQNKGIQIQSWYNMNRYSKVCPYCTGRYRTTEEFRMEIYDINPNITILGEYSGVENKIECKCNICGHVWNPIARSLRQSGCPKCANKRKGDSRRKSHDEFVVKLRTIQPNLIPIDQYDGSHKSMKFKCLIHDIDFYSIPSNLLNDSAHCPECTKDVQRKRVQSVHDFFVEKVSKIRDDIEVIGVYNGYHSDVECKCKIHNYNFLSKPVIILDNHITCPLCKADFGISSNGESKIMKFLKLNNISFNDQHKFNDCKYITYLKYDFFLPDYNLCVEFDGEQHYEPVCFGDMTKEDAIEAFHSTKIRDQIKNNYCKEKDIGLLRIPYWDYDNIEKILTTVLNLDPQRLSG